jgi:hypothetical protein
MSHWKIREKTSAGRKTNFDDILKQQRIKC